MFARISDYWRRVLSERFHALMHLGGFPTSGRVPLHHDGLLAIG